MLKLALALILYIISLIGFKVIIISSGLVKLVTAYTLSRANINFILLKS